VLLNWKSEWTFQKACRDLGFPGSIKNTIIWTIKAMLMMIVVAIIISFVSMKFGIYDQDKIISKINGLPIYVLAVAVLIAPIGEELLFRGFLLRWVSEKVDSDILGIVISSIVFGVLHMGYGSVVEVFGTMTIGLVLGYTFIRSKSITPCIVVHMVYNLLSLWTLRTF
jgi:membrane protease YdiL (CAAX protease family)